ncbi:MAG: antibiotic biosynthesis monooxygenase [Microthrixaceae bacterium]|nr:antibiotic biosynthesis monooxygenase [Microthrixaceae bacterium]
MNERQSLPNTPEPPYYAVVFASTRPTDVDDGYEVMADAMFELAADQPGFIGADSVRGADGAGITVSYWTDEEAIAAWHAQADHLVAQAAGYDRFYESFSIRVARVERQYGFDRAGTD